MTKVDITSEEFLEALLRLSKSEEIIVRTERAAELTTISKDRLVKGRRTGKLAKSVPAPQYVELGDRSVGYTVEDLKEWARNLPRPGKSDILKQKRRRRTA